jgi:adenylate cyclase
MYDVPLSAATRLAWQLAGDFAVRCGDPAIQPWHLLYAIFSVEKVASVREGPHTPAESEQLRSESERLISLAQRHKLSAAVVRRTLRESQSIKPQASRPVPGSKVISRSPKVRTIFDEAAQLAQQRGSEELDLLLLLETVLESQDGVISNFMINTMPALANLVCEMQECEPMGAAVLSGGVSGVADLDAERDAASQPLHIADSIDVDRAVQAPAASATERLTWLSELAWEFGTAGELDRLLQRASEELLHILPQAEHNVILVREKSDDELLLKAFSPGSWTPRVSMTSVRRAMEDKRGYIWMRGDDMSVSQRDISLETGMYVPLVINGQALGAICVDSTHKGQHFGCGELELVTCFAHQVVLAIANHELQTSLKQNAEVLQRLLTNFSPKVRTRLLQRAQMGRLALGGELSIVSILCSDIRGFTRLTANMRADDIVGMLNEYFAALVECIFRNDGTIDKFVGDSILAVFGSPEADPKHHQKAVAAAVEMQQVAQQVSERRVARGEAACQFGIGVHAGEVLHGFIGSAERMEFTVIGEAVNLAARYTDGAQAGEVLISPEVHQRVWTSFPSEKVSITTKHEGDLPAYRVALSKAKSEKSTAS